MSRAPLDGGLRPGRPTGASPGLARWCGWVAVVVGTLAVFLLGRWVAQYSTVWATTDVEEPQTAADHEAIYHQLSVAHSTLTQVVAALITVGAVLAVRSLLLRRAHRGCSL